MCGLILLVVIASSSEVCTLLSAIMLSCSLLVHYSAVGLTFGVTLKSKGSQASVLSDIWRLLYVLFSLVLL